jgi:rhodanese-related sulfurtransferase
LDPRIGLGAGLGAARPGRATIAEVPAYARYGHPPNGPTGSPRRHRIATERGLPPWVGVEPQPGTRTTIDDLLAQARAGLTRLRPQEARAAMRAGALLLDIRSESQRAADGAVAGSIAFARNVLEWRCDPASEGHDERISDLGRQLIVMCDEGYQSSLAAATLQQLGFARATDVAGGFQAWRAAGLPVDPPAPR